MLDRIAQSVTEGCTTETEKASAIRAYVSSHIRHDYENSNPAPIEPEETLKRGTGKCGQRAVLFQALAMSVGLKARIVMYRGHIRNEVFSNGVWLPFDTTIPLHKAHEDHINLITSGPVFGYAYTPDIARYEAMPIVLGQYSKWLRLLKKRVHTLLPKQIFMGEGLDGHRPNVIIRHDIDFNPSQVLPLLHEENALGMKSVTYVRVDGETYDHKKSVDMLRMFEHYAGFEVGLHITAVNRCGMTMNEAYARFEEQLEEANQDFEVWTVQAHGYANEHGETPFVNNYVIESQVDYGLSNILKKTHAFKWRIADSCGTMHPGDPMEWIPKMKKGKLYYCLWHPEFYRVENGWATYRGTPESFNALLGGVALP